MNIDKINQPLDALKSVRPRLPCPLTSKPGYSRKSADPLKVAVLDNEVAKEVGDHPVAHSPTGEGIAQGCVDAVAKGYKTFHRVEKPVGTCLFLHWRTWREILKWF